MSNKNEAPNSETPNLETPNSDTQNSDTPNSETPNLETQNSDTQNSEKPFLDKSFCEDVTHKASELGEIIAKNIKQDEKHYPNYKEMIEATNKMMTIITQKIEFFNNDIFQEDFIKSIKSIDEAYNAYLKSINFTISKQQTNLNLFISLNNFIQSIKIFSNIIEEISNSNDEYSFVRLGIESVLFSFSVNVVQIEEEPFYKSRFVEIYKYYNEIHEIEDKMAAIQSVCGTGKTLLLPIILICKSLKEKMNVPFLILTEMGPKNVESNEMFFKKVYSKYLTIVTDPDELVKMYNDYEETKQISKMVLAVLTPHSLLPMTHKVKDNQLFYPSTRFIIDEIHQRPFYVDVLISHFAVLNEKLNIFTLPLNLVLTSATIQNKMLKPFNEKMKKIKLIHSTPFEIVEKEPIIEPNIFKNNEVVCNETIKVIEEMAKTNSTIEEGHILCFLSGIRKCYILRNNIISSLKQSEESENQRRIIIFETLLKPNETTESYFRRLREEYLLNESLRGGNDYKYDFLYFAPIVLSGRGDDAIFELAGNDFPSDLSKIHKLIFSTQMIESSFNIEGLSVVVDSGLTKETEFDSNTGLSSSTEKQATQESLNQRKGRLGRSMKGLYIPIITTEEPLYKYKIPSIQRNDFTTDFLLLKDININFERMKNLPSCPNQQHLKFAIDTLLNMKAIYPETLKITKFGKEALQFVSFPYISIYDAAAIVSFKNKYPDDKKAATFTAAFIISIIAMESNLIQENMTENMSRLFNEDSDITTIVHSLLKILYSKITENDQLRDLAESYGFSYTGYLTFKSHLEEVIKIITNKEAKLSQYLKKMKYFVINNFKDITFVVDKLIPEIAKVTPNWKNIHSIRYKYVNGVGNFNSTPSIVFNGDNKLLFENQHQKNAEVKITKRPGWNGIMIPMQCYCFCISRNANSNQNFGYLIHRMNEKSKGEIASIECDKMALNPWFHVLLDTYLKDSSLEVKYFTNLIKSTNKAQKPDHPNLEKRMFHYSNAGERVFISFIPSNDEVKNKISNAIKKCLKLMPFTPRSILIFRNDVKSILEIKSIGTQHYETSISTLSYATILDAKSIDECIKNLDELKKSNSKIRICALFTDKSCNVDYYDKKQLYIINTEKNKWPMLKDIVFKRVNEMRDIVREKNKKARRIDQNNPNKLNYFQFPPRFIHPALMYDKKSRESIIDWFTNKCDYAHVVKIVGHRFLIKQREITILQEHLQNDKEQIMQEMNLNNVAIPVPCKVFSEAYVTIRDHPTWKYNSRFKVIITTKEESESVIEFINSIKEKLKNGNDKSDEFTDTLCCLYICDDPDNPVLTEYPITIYFNDGTSYTNKMCRDCILSTLQNTTESYYINGVIDQEALYKIHCRPSCIPIVDSKEINHGRESWPQIPFGQMVSTLINNDDKMSGFISAWLCGISEFTIRVQERDRFAFCPDHPSFVFNIDLCGRNKVIECKDCHNIFCKFCLGWHKQDFVCEEKKNGVSKTWNKKCPRCKVLTYKDGGCNHISCPCGCHWCYKCGAGFSNSDDCYRHMDKKHGGCFDYDFD